MLLSSARLHAAEQAVVIVEAVGCLCVGNKSLLSGCNAEPGHKSEIMATEGPLRPDTTYVSEQEQPNGSYNSVGTEAVVNNRASQVYASDTYPSDHSPSPSANVSSKVGAGLGFAFVAIIIGAVLIWKRNSKISTYTNSASNAHIGSTRRHEKEYKRRRGLDRSSSSKRKIDTTGSGRSHKNKKENRTIYDSDSSIDSAFEINKRMKRDHNDSDPEFALDMSTRIRRMKIDPVNSDSDSESSCISVTPHRNRTPNPNR